MPVPLSVAATAFAAEHFGSEVSYVLEKLRLLHDLGQFYLRSKRDPTPDRREDPPIQTAEETLELPLGFDFAADGWRSRMEALARRAEKALRRGLISTAAEALTASAANGTADGVEREEERIYPWEVFSLTTIEPPQGTNITTASKIVFRTQNSSGKLSFEVTMNLGDDSFNSIYRRGRHYNYGGGHVFELISKPSEYITLDSFELHT